MIQQLCVASLLIAIPAISNRDLLAQDQPDRLQVLFDSLDANSDGSLSPAEFPRKLLFRRLDRDGNGLLSMSEAEQAISRYLGSQSSPSTGSKWTAAEFTNPLPDSAPFSKESILAAAEYSATHQGLSFLVYHDGKLIYEDYPNEGRPDRANELASGTKSFSGLLAAAAVADGLLTWDERVSDTLTSWQSDPQKKEITVTQLLQLTSGVNPDGDGPLKVPSYEDAIQADSLASPGEKFAYGPTPFQCFGELVRLKLIEAGNNESVLDYLERRILDPIGLKVGRWRKDSNGNIRLPSGCALTAREWAKFGELVRQEGTWKGEEVIPKEQLDRCFEGSSVNPAYGITFWLNQKVSASTRRNIPQLRFATDDFTGNADIPGDVVMAAGAGKQRCFISRQGKFVIVRQASGVVEAVVGRPKRGFSDAEFLAIILATKS